MNKKKFKDSIGDKGYYIALVLCAVAIGITGFLYYRNTDEPVNSLNNPTDQAGVVQDDDVHAVGPQPGDTENPTEPSATLPQKPSTVKFPVEGETIAQYSMDALTYNPTTRDWRVHDGVDIAAATGTTVCAAADGTVYTVYEDEMMGTTVVIRHDGGYTTKYASLDENVPVQPGQTVTAGQSIGTVGVSALLESAIGEHVHFSVSCDGVPVNPADFLEQA